MQVSRKGATQNLLLGVMQAALPPCADGQKQAQKSYDSHNPCQQGEVEKQRMNLECAQSSNDISLYTC